MKESSWEERAKALGIREEDLEEQFIRGSGPGGQKINKTSATVLLRHLPSGTEIRCQATRSRSANRELARQWLCDTLEARDTERRDQARSEREKERRRKRPKPASLKRRMVEHKRRRSGVKKGRGNWKSED